MNFSKVLPFWFPKNETKFQDFWFSSIRDYEIKLFFSDIVNNLSKMTIDDISKLISHSTDYDLILSIVICLDQFTRNIYRNEGKKDRSIFSKTDDLCLSLLNHYNILDNLHNYPINKRIFLLLPYRHQRKTPFLNIVMVNIKKMEREILSMNKSVTKKNFENIIKRFKLATIKDYSKVTDTIKYFDNTIDSKKRYLDKDSLDIILDPICLTYSMKPLPLIIDLSKTNIYRILVSHFKRLGIKRVCISLSGGVDSMVISYYLVILWKEKIIDDVCAVHVDYGNRNVSKREADFVTSWTSYLGIPLIKRRIEHIKRNGSTILTKSIDRTTYEQETKNIRFNLYRYAMADKKHLSQCVILGHHGGDLTENVMMNVLRDGDILDLYTMKEYQKIDGVNISRPLLETTKDDIYKMAHLYEIPYLADTTSESCMRGVLRKTVMPSLISVDSSITTKINSIGKASSEWALVIDSMIIKPIIDSVRKYKNGIVLPWKSNYFTMPSVCWQKILCNIFHSNNISMISNKNLIVFLEWIKKKNSFLRLSNDMVLFSYYYNDEYYLVFIKSSIARRNIELDKVLGKPIPITFDIKTGDIYNTSFNGWDITIDTTISSRINKYDFNNRILINDVMDGEFSFYYRTCEHSISSYRDDSHLRGNISYSMGKKNSDNKRFFKAFPLSRYIPCVHLGKTCKTCKTCKTGIVYKILYKYKV